MHSNCEILLHWEFAPKTFRGGAYFFILEGFCVCIILILRGTIGVNLCYYQIAKFKKAHAPQ